MSSTKSTLIANAPISHPFSTRENPQVTTEPRNLVLLFRLVGWYYELVLDYDDKHPRSLLLPLRYACQRRERAVMYLSLVPAHTFLPHSAADPTKQKIYYQQGIGTYKSTNTASKVLEKAEQALDAAVAIDLGQHIRDGYRFLMETYQPVTSDFNVLCGRQGALTFLRRVTKFSSTGSPAAPCEHLLTRGDSCYYLFPHISDSTARALAGMVQQVGILLPGNGESINLAYDIYKSNDKWLIKPDCGTKDCRKCGELLADSFKRSFSRSADIHFVGVWDTVASVGAVIPRSLPFANGAEAIKFFRHAVSLDERRSRFPVQLWPGDGSCEEVSCKKASPKLKHDEFHPKREEEKTTGTNVKEVFFSGSHSDIGGGAQATDGLVAPRLSHLSLRWMIPFADEAYDEFKKDASAARQPEAKKALNYVLSLIKYATRDYTDMGSAGKKRIEEESRAGRTDALSFNIATPKVKAGEGLIGKAKWIGKGLLGMKDRLVQRVKTVGWKALEMIPTIKRPANDKGGASKWTDMTIKPGFGLGRTVPGAIVCHGSVQIRMKSPVSSFEPPTGSSVLEWTEYVPKVWTRDREKGSRSSKPKMTFEWGGEPARNEGTGVGKA
ncbi:hypothetical protein P7C70_g7703, partial [Phenoliferia sp. Uapishka_3]